MKANIAFAFPQSSICGTSKNSSVFMVAIIKIWAIALNLDLHLLTIQIAIKISENPITMVIALACSLPRIVATICWCLGTRFSTLQNNPFIIQMIAMQKLMAV